MVLAGAVVAAVVVLLMGALRSGLPATPVAPLTASAPPGSSGLRSLPVTQTVAPTSASTPAPPDPTAISDLRGEFVGPLGHVESCPILYEREGVLELVLPDGYRSRMRSGAIEIVRADGSVVAAEGQL